MRRHEYAVNPTRGMRSRSTDRRAFTLIELLTVITIMGMLLAMLLPAVQEVREAMRKAACRNNLDQLGKAVLSYRSTFHKYPSGGWGYRWTGDPELGSHRRQPGGWLHNIIQFLDMQDVYEKGQSTSDLERRTFAAKLLSREMQVFICPSRRPPDRVYPITNTPINCDSLTFAVRTDFAINAGDQTACQFDGGPSSPVDGANDAWWTANLSRYDTRAFTGISFTRSEVAENEVIDGLHFVYLAAEKYMDPNNYLNGADPGDLYGAYVGFGPHAFRTGATPPLRDNTPNPPANRLCSWGGPHAVTFNAVFLDGSVRSVHYGISPNVHANLANRMNGTVDPSEDQL